MGGDGTALSVPGMPGCNLERKRLVPSPPVVEVAGAVLAYPGDEQHPRPCERSFVEVSRLPYGASVEIEAVARRR